MNLPEQAFEITRTITPSLFLRKFKKEEESCETKLEKSLYRVEFIPKKGLREGYYLDGFTLSNLQSKPKPVTKTFYLDKYSIVIIPIVKNIKTKKRKFKQGRYKIEDSIYYFEYFTADFQVDHIVDSVYHQIEDIFSIEKEDLKRALIEQ